MTEDSHVTRAEFDAMNKQIQDLHRALMEPEPGHTKSLLNRMAEVTINVETGAQTMRSVGAFVRAAVLLLAFLAAVGISVKLGVNVVESGP